MPAQVVSNLVRVRTLVARHIARQDEARTNEFLYAASRGDTDRVLQVRFLSSFQAHRGAKPTAATVTVCLMSADAPERVRCQHCRLRRAHCHDARVRQGEPLSCPELIS